MTNPKTAHAPRLSQLLRDIHPLLTSRAALRRIRAIGPPITTDANADRALRLDAVHIHGDAVRPRDPAVLAPQQAPAATAHCDSHPGGLHALVWHLLDPGAERSAWLGWGSRHERVDPRALGPHALSDLDVGCQVRDAGRVVRRD